MIKGIQSSIKGLKRNNYSKAGFTLLEVLISVAIIGVLFLIIDKFVNITSRQSRVFNTRQQSDMSYNIFKGQVMKDLTQGKITANPATNPYTFDSGLYTYSCGCAKAPATPTVGADNYYVHTISPRW